MKRKLLILAALALTALIASRLVSIAQPVTSGGGLSRVTTTGSAFEGSGTTTNPLKLRTDCANGSALAYNTGASRWDCASMGGITGTGTTDTGTRWTSSTAIGNASFADTGTAMTVKDFRGTILSPSILGSNQDNWNPTNLSTATTIYVTESTTVQISGLQGGTEGRRLTIHNGSAQLLYLLHESGSSTAANRFYSPYGDAALLEQDNQVTLEYISSRWRILTKSGRFQRSWLVDGAFTAYLGAQIYGDSTFGDGPEDDFVMTNGANIQTGDTRGIPLTPSALGTGDNNNYNPTDLNKTRILRLAGGDASVLTGLQGGAAGRYLTICCVGNPFSLTDEDTDSSAANRFKLPNGATVTLRNEECLDIVYDATDSRWLVHGQRSDWSSLSLSGTLVVAGATTLNGSGTFGDSNADSFAFSNGPTGINSYVTNNIAGKHYEWNEEWMQVGLTAEGSAGDTTFGDIVQVWYHDGSGTAAGTESALVSGRPGVAALITGSTATGRSAWRTNGDTDFNVNTTTIYASTVAVDAVAAVGTQEYGVTVGFWDTFNSFNQTDGCYFLYDRNNAATAPGTGNRGAGADKWQCWCASNGTRTAYLMDGTIVSQGSFTTVNAPISGATFQRLEVLVTGTSTAEFYVNGVKSCHINTNIPSGSSRLSGAGHEIYKSVGTTARRLYVDQSRLDFTLSSARSP